MPVTLNDNALEDQQQLEVAVSGPDGANRLYVCTGRTFFAVTVGSPNLQSIETLAFLVGPQLTQAQFRRAIATASFAGISFSQSTSTPPASATWSITSIDADWDDESGKVQVQVEVAVSLPVAGTVVQVQRIAYQVSILAAM
jgi:hypothetical protein